MARAGLVRRGTCDQRAGSGGRFPKGITCLEALCVLVYTMLAPRGRCRRLGGRICRWRSYHGSVVQLCTMAVSIWILAGGIVQNAARYPRGLCTVDCGRTYDGIKKLRRRKGAVLPRAWRWSAASLAEIVRPRGPLFGEADDRGSATRCWQAGNDKQEAARVPLGHRSSAGGIMRAGCASRLAAGIEINTLGGTIRLMYRRSIYFVGQEAASGTRRARA